MSKTTPETTAEAQHEAVEVVLIKAHEHAGRHYHPGDTIAVTRQQHEWLRKQEVIE